MASDESHDSTEKQGLSARMRELISIATVEERRDPKSHKRTGPKSERRRRTDLTTEPEKKAS